MGKRARSIRIGLFYYRAKEKISGKGPVGKFFSERSIKEIMKISKANINDSIFHVEKFKILKKSYQFQEIK